ncbi:MAG TPA: superoxide dismutase family protein [Pedococcus sp.]|jgi:Cu/Zn superoxide dismutase|uniref:superoxide dismutase family protein n=1 Tax=Pedococcus sp. TaxID=2860345 RepID=UPI002F93E741
MGTFVPDTPFRAAHRTTHQGTPRASSGAARRRLAAGVAALAATAAAAGAATVGPAQAGQGGGGDGTTLVFQSPLSDLQTATTEPFEGASATLRLTMDGGESTFVLKVAGIDRSAAGTHYGAHLHTGPCTPGDGAAAGPHYNSASPPVIDEEHEVWLDFEVTGRGSARAVADVPFEPVHGARSVVIHAEETDPATGLAGARLACMPVVW